MNEEIYQDAKRMAETFERLAKADWRKKPIDGIKASELRVLVCIKKLSVNGSVTVSDISKRLSITSPTVTQLVKSLSSGDYITKKCDAHDKRVADITLTAKGDEIVEKVYDRYRMVFSGLIESLGKEKTETLISLLNEVHGYLEIENSKE